MCNFKDVFLNSRFVSFIPFLNKMTHIIMEDVNTVTPINFCLYCITQ